MPITWTVSDSGDLLVFWYSGRITPEEARIAQIESWDAVPPGGEFVSLMLFDDDVTAPDATLDALTALYRGRGEQLKARGMHRRAGAAVGPGSADARHLMPLWNALRHLSDMDVTFTMFDDLDEAIEFLGVDRAAAMAVIERRPPASEPPDDRANA